MKPRHPHRTGRAIGVVRYVAGLVAALLGGYWAGSDGGSGSAVTSAPVALALVAGWVIAHVVAVLLLGRLARVTQVARWMRRLRAPPAAIDRITRSLASWLDAAAMVAIAATCLAAMLLSVGLAVLGAWDMDHGIRWGIIGVKAGAVALLLSAYAPWAMPRWGAWWRD